MFKAKEDAPKLQGENKALRLQLNHLSDELVKANQEIVRLTTALEQERRDGDVKSGTIRTLTTSNECLVSDMAVRDQIIASLKDEIRRTDLRVMELEGTAKEREVQFERQLTLLRRALAQASGDVASGTSVSPNLSPASASRQLDGTNSGNVSDDGREDGRGGGGGGKARRGSVVPPAPLLKKCTVLMYNVDSPMMQSQTEHIVERSRSLGSFIVNVVKLARGFCETGRAFITTGENFGEALMNARCVPPRPPASPVLCPLCVVKNACACAGMHACVAG